VRALTDFFEDARAYAKARDASGQAGLPPQPKVPAWEAMLPVLRGEMPLMVHADEVRQIQAAVHWTATNHCRMILAGGRDAWKVAGLLASNHVAVVYAHTFTLPPRDTEAYDTQFKAAAMLYEAGVKLALAVPSASLVKNLPYAAAQAVAFGLPEAAALKAMTLVPAEVLGVAERLGSIQAGKDATLIATDGPLLDIRANVRRMWIGGREVSLENRHTRLYEKYRSRPRPK